MSPNCSRATLGSTPSAISASTAPGAAWPPHRPAPFVSGDVIENEADPDLPGVIAWPKVTVDDDRPNARTVVFESEKVSTTQPDFTTLSEVACRGASPVNPTETAGCGLAAPVGTAAPPSIRRSPANVAAALRSRHRVPITFGLPNLIAPLNAELCRSAPNFQDNFARHDVKPHDLVCPTTWCHSRRSAVLPTAVSGDRSVGPRLLGGRGEACPPEWCDLSEAPDLR